MQKCKNIYKVRGYISVKEAIFTRLTKNCKPSFWNEAYRNKRNKNIAKAFTILYPFMRSADCLLKNYNQYDLLMLDLLYLMCC